MFRLYGGKGGGLVSIEGSEMELCRRVESAVDGY